MRLRFLRERDDLVVAEPEPNARGVALVGGARRAPGRRFLLTDRSLARDQDEHPASLVVAKPHLADLPFRLPWYEPTGRPGVFGHGDSLRLHHLVQPDDQGLDLRLLARQGQLAAEAAGDEEELAL